MDKMKTVVRKAVLEPKEILSTAEFRNQFADLMKSINQSYTILKGSVIGDKKKADDESVQTETKADSSIGLFKKLRVKKIVVPNSRDKSREPLSKLPDTVLDLAPLKESKRTFKLTGLVYKGGQAEAKKSGSTLQGYGSSEENSRPRYRHRSEMERSLSRDRVRSRDILDNIGRKQTTSFDIRARRRLAEELDTSLSSHEVRRPDFSSILLGDKFNMSGLKTVPN